MHKHTYQSKGVPLTMSTPGEAVAVIYCSDLENVRAHVAALRQHGFSVCVLDQSRLALEALERPDTGLLVVDAACPDAATVLESARSHAAGFPCIVLTDFTRPELLAGFGDAFLWPTEPSQASGLAALAAQIVAAPTVASRIRKLEAENEGLRAGIAEAHHRIKNSLQNVISLINLQLRRAGQLNESDVQKLSAHIHGLAVLHDLLMAQARAGQTMESVPVERIFERLSSILARGGNEARLVTGEILDSCRVGSRQAASLGIIFNEIVSNALRHGTGRVEIQLENDGVSGLLTVRNEGSSFPENFSPEKSSKSGLALIRLLCSADLGSEPQFRTVDGMAEVRVRFPLYSSNQAQSGGSEQSSEVVQ